MNLEERISILLLTARLFRFEKGKEVKSEVEGLDLAAFEAQLEKTMNSHATAGWSV